ncbi:hypothetical protein GCM10007916_25630 [Psychromonas marina]|uniref:Uncharacterized protein n=1 Tax=Psychromonas marina TaxID=88364 RepID=A0ABQ6E2M9_9GAMM|nr:hypothetical protein [Psychromonas marina]GLS91494.1 hypothetical protein GCM10007916_25630 [Psychromonas marina]
MLAFSLLSELDRKVILFTHEKRTRDKNRLSSTILSEEYRAFIITEGEYILWELQKRKLTEAEVIAHAWLVTSVSNISLMFNFQKNNQLTISSLFENFHCSGDWQLEHGILKVAFVYEGHSYDINIIANNNRSIHSALQIVDNQRSELLKVAPIINATQGTALLD